MSEFTDKLDIKLFDMVQRIKAALGTAEDGDALIEVARNAHRAEMELAALKHKEQFAPMPDCSGEQTGTGSAYYTGKENV